jgi:hypothetical protein
MMVLQKVYLFKIKCNLNIYSTCDENNYVNLSFPKLIDPDDITVISAKPPGRLRFFTMALVVGSNPLHVI